MPRKKGVAEIWRSESTQKALTRHFLGKISENPTRGRDGVTSDSFKMELSINVRRMSHELRRGTYNFSTYLQVLKLKGANKLPREISIPAVRDRITLKAMSSTLNRLHSFCSIELAQSQVARVVKVLELKTFDYFLKLDVKEFYPSIDHPWLEKVLTKRVRSKKFRELLMKAVRTSSSPTATKPLSKLNQKGVPQGLAISNALAELSIRHLDETMARIENIVYFRYVDDILIFMKEDVSEELFSLVEYELSKAGLEVHGLSKVENGKSSTGLISAGFEYLGYRFFWPRVTVRQVSFTKLEARIARIFTRHKYIKQRYANDQAGIETSLTRLEWYLNLTITGCVLEGKRYGWLAYFSQMRHHQLLEHLDWLVKKQMARHGVANFTPKSFVKSYRYAASRIDDHSGYVPNFDLMLTDQKRQLMVTIFGWRHSTIEQLSDEELETRFSRRMRRLTIELEQDVSASY